MIKPALYLAVLLVIAGCDDEIEYVERPQPRTAAEIAFVKDVFNNIQPQSFAENREYCGYIGLNGDGAFAATPAKRGRQNSCVPRYAPKGFVVLASYHTHGAAALAVDTEMPSFDDLEADIYEATDGYIATPGGRLWYDDVAVERVILLCGANCVAADQRHVDTRVLVVGTSYGLATLSSF